MTDAERDGRDTDPDESRGRRQPGIRLGSILGVPVYLQASWFVFAVVIAATYAPVARSHVPDLGPGREYAVAGLLAVLLLISVFLHEMGHAVVSQRRGIRVRSMTLWMLGGYTEMEQESPSPATEFLVSVAGPLVSLGVGGVAVLVAAVTEPATVGRELATQAALSNLLVGVFNLLPGLPLDGGRLLQAGVWRLTGNRFRGTAAAGWAGRVVAVLVVATALVPLLLGANVGFGVLFSVLVGLFLWSGATQALRAARLGSRFGLLHAAKLARPVVAVPGDTPLAEALRRADDIGARSVVVVDGDGRAAGILVEQAAAAVPEDRRPWVEVQSVSRTLTAGHVLSAELAGEALFDAVRRHPATEYLVVDRPAGGPERVVGVLAAVDVAETLEPSTSEGNAQPRNNHQ
jgi:Zn-dependent protease/CBS domain-containing protein